MTTDEAQRVLNSLTHRIWLLAGFVFVLAIAVSFVASRSASTDATFTDRIASIDNDVKNGNLQPPVLTANVSGSTVNLSWTNPDLLSGPNASFIVQRASGNCTSPGTFSPISGSPFSGTSTTNSPGTGTWCYVVVAKYYNWTSPFGTSASVNQKTATIAATATGFYLSKQTSAATCADYQLATSLGNVNNDGDDTISKLTGSKIWTYTTKPPNGIGTGTFTFAINGRAESGPVNLVLEVGYCASNVQGNFVAVGSTSVTFTQSATNNVQTFTGTVPTAHTLTGVQTLAIRIRNVDTLDDLKIKIGQPQSTASTVSIP
jgi:hypothetical protein